MDPAEGNALLVSAFIDRQREIEHMRAQNQQLREEARALRARLAEQARPAEGDRPA